MTKSKILWYALGGWSLFFVVLILLMLLFYSQEIETRTYQERLEAKRSVGELGIDPDETAAAVWSSCFLFVWFIGALPLFIAAIVTRRK